MAAGGGVNITPLYRNIRLKVLLTKRENRTEKKEIYFRAMCIGWPGEVCDSNGSRPKTEFVGFTIWRRTDCTNAGCTCTDPIKRSSTSKTPLNPPSCFTSRRDNSHETSSLYSAGSPKGTLGRYFNFVTLQKSAKQSNIISRPYRLKTAVPVRWSRLLWLFQTRQRWFTKSSFFFFSITRILSWTVMINPKLS